MDNYSLSSEITSTLEGMKVWQQERVMLDATERICELMAEQSVSRAELATRLNRSRSYVTQILRGNANLTLRTMSDVFLALNRQFHIHDGPVTIENDDGAAVLSMSFHPDDDNLGEAEVDDVHYDFRVG